MVELTNGHGLIVENCFFNRPGGNGLLLSNYLRGTVVEGNEFLYTGDNAIVSLGATQLIDATAGLQPRGTEIAHNLAHEAGIWVKQQGALYQGLTAGTHLHHNVFFNGPRAGVNVSLGCSGCLLRVCVAASGVVLNTCERAVQRWHGGRPLG